MDIRVIRFSLILLFCFCWTNFSSAIELPIVKVKVNDQDVRLVLDTGASSTFLFSTSAERINLSWTDPPVDIKARPNEMLFGLSEECRFEYGDQSQIVHLNIVNNPYVKALGRGIDGLLAWSDTVDPIFYIDVDSGNYSSLKELPEDIDSWSKSELEDDPLLTVKLKNITEKGGGIFIDTGFEGGVALGDERWQDWLDKNKEQTYTLAAMYTLTEGLSINKVYCADELEVGNFKITNVLVSKHSSGAEFHYKGDEEIYHEATLGLYALSRLEIITDRDNRVIYNRPKSSPKSQFLYNRIAAVFTPKNLNNDDLEAHVVIGGPAYEAGVRNGDILIKIDDLDVTKWKSNPEVLPLSRFWKSPPGTQLELTLKRNGKPITATLKLEEIFSNCILGENYSKEVFVEPKDIKSLRTLAYQYYEGKKVKKDYKLAAKYFKKASEQGDANSQLDLGWMYLDGIGVPKDEKEAAKWFQKAADQGLEAAAKALEFIPETAQN